MPMPCATTSTISGCAGCSDLATGEMFDRGGASGFNAGGLVSPGWWLLSVTGSVAAGLDVPERLEVFVDRSSSLSTEGLDGIVLCGGELVGSTTLADSGLMTGGSEE